LKRKPAKKKAQMTNEEISFKDLTRDQLSNLKETYINLRIDSMSEKQLKDFARDVIDLQVNGTVGNQEEKEIWKEMKEFFKDDFETKIKEVIKLKGSANEILSPEQEELNKRLELLEQRKKEKSEQNTDMW
tara:strand:- start:421 stop:813 length:393 start_codon:yes stop_codon:yes gene_type:complete